MKSERIFINYSPADTMLAEQIRDVLLRQDISVYLPPAGSNAEAAVAAVEKMEQIVREGGIMLTVLSADSVKEDLFISNFQYMCELAGERRVMLIYRVGEVKDDASIALYYTQSVIVQADKEDAPAFQALITQAKRLLGLEKSRSWIPRRVNPKLTRKLICITFFAALGLGIIWYLIRASGTQQNESALPTPTPVVEPTPMSGESVDQQLIVAYEDHSFDFEVQDDPQEEAPFTFQPAFITKTISFDDPEYDSSYDNKELSVFDTGAGGFGGRTSLFQKEGVLQVTYTVPDYLKQRGSAQVGIKHLFTLSDTSYIGIRFRIPDYEGWTNAGESITGYFDFCIGGYGCQSIIGFDLVQQLMDIEDGKSFELGTSWHVLELRLDAEKNGIEIYLDGDYVKMTTNISDKNQYNYIQLNFPYDATTDWVNFYLDEVRYGGDHELHFAQIPGDAPFHFSVEPLTVVEDFDTYPLVFVFNQGAQYTELLDGVLRFDIPNGENSSTDVELQTQISSISQVNYYAIRYRIFNTGPEYWSGWGGLGMWLFPNEDIRDRYAGIVLSRYHPNFTIYLGPHKEFFLEGTDDNSPFGLWHTLEMVLMPSSEDSASYGIQLWHDGYFVMEGEIDSTIGIIDSDQLTWAINLRTGSDAMNNFSGEIDEIRAGYISPDLTEELE